MLFPSNRVSPAGVIDPHMLIVYGVWSIIIVSLVQVMTSILQGTGDFKTAPINMTIGLIVKLALNYILIATKLNILGAIISTYICYIIVFILDYAAVVRRTNIKINFPKLACAPFCATFVMSALVGGFMYLAIKILSSNGYYSYSTNAVCAVIAMLLGGVTYFVFALKFKAIGKGDVSSVPLVGRFLRKPVVSKFVEKIVK